MKNRLIYIAVAVCMIFSLVPVVISAPAVLAAATLHVGDGQDYETIQEAIDAAADGDTIIVHDGEYDEYITIDVPNLTIKSENGAAVTVINGSGLAYDSLVDIAASGVIFGGAGQGFTVTEDEAWGDTGIGVWAESGTVLSGITIEDNAVAYFGYGIYLWDEGDAEVSGCTVKGNEIYECYDGVSLYSGGGLAVFGNTVSDNVIHDCNGDGIYIGTGEDGGNVYLNTVYNNSIYDCDDGIWVDNYGDGDIHSNVIRLNTVYNISDYGIYFDNEDYGDVYNNSVLDNLIHDCALDDDGAGIGFENDENDGDIYENTVSGNTVYNASDGISFSNIGEGSLYGNAVAGNTVFNCDDDGIYFYDHTVHSVHDNAITGNTVYDCFNGAGILLYAYNGDIYDNSISGNTVWDCEDGIGVEAWGGYSDISNITISGNSVFCMDYVGCNWGIYLHIVEGPDNDIYDCTIEDNTVWGWGRGICLCDDISDNIYYINVLGNTLYSTAEDNVNSTGIYVAWCNDITIGGNDIQHCTGDAGIYTYRSFYIDICGNNIAHNGLDYAGIYVWESCSVYVNCNNIEDNWSYDYDEYVGLYEYDDYSTVYAGDNWWGDGDGPYYWENYTTYYGDGDSVYGLVSMEDGWLDERLSFEGGASAKILDYAAVPGAVSLFPNEMFGDLYSGGPDYADIIVEVDCGDECGVQHAAANISALLLDLLPADFMEKYYDEWSEGDQDYWDSWMSYLSERSMSFDKLGYWNEEEEELDYYCVYDYYFDLEDLLFSDWECLDYCYSEYGHYYGCMDCFGLDFFFYPDDYYALFNLIFEELRMGQHEVPVTVYTCWDEYVVNVPLAVVDLQIPLDEGWNLRSAPASLDPSCNDFEEILALGDGMDGLQAVITYDSSTGTWVQPGDPAFPDTMAPLSAYYIYMSGQDQMGFVISRNPSAPVAQLYAGWNLVGPSPIYGYLPDESYINWPEYSIFPAMTPWDALSTAWYTQGNPPGIGWTQVINPPEDTDYTEYFYYKEGLLDKPSYDKYFYQPYWTMVRDGEGYDYYGFYSYYDLPFVTPFGGYWVFMENDDLLAGGSVTPLPWESLIGP